MEVLKDHKYSILDAVEWLKFEKNYTSDLQGVLNAFTAFSRSKFMRLVAEKDNYQKAVSSIQYKIQLFDEASFSNWILMPRVLNLIYRPEGIEDQDWLAAIDQFLDVELVWKNGNFEGVERAMPSMVWSVNGKGFIRKDEAGDYHRYEAPCLFNRAVLDFFSPYNASLGKESYLTYDSTQELEMHSFEEAEEIMDKFEALFEGVDEQVKTFTDLFVDSIHLKKILNEGQYASCTSGGYIGRVLIGSALSHRDELLIEAVVHESIHGLLFMLDEMQQWMPPTSMSVTQEYNIASPWTGNQLNVRNVLQACFVWYGLFTFWTAYNKKHQNAFITNRIQFIREGFEKLTFDFGMPLDQHTLDALTLVKKEVLSYE